MADFSHFSEPWLVSKKSGALTLTEDVIAEHWGKSEFEQTIMEHIRKGIEEGLEQQQKIDAQKDFYFALEQRLK